MVDHPDTMNWSFGGFIQDITCTIAHLFAWFPGKIILACLFALVGPLDYAYLALAIAMVLDQVTGIAKAVYLKKFIWAKLRKSAGKWLVYFVLIVMAHQAGMVSGLLSWMREASAVFIFLTEYKSIAENLRCMGFPIPMPEDIANVLKRIRDR